MLEFCCGKTGVQNLIFPSIGMFYVNVVVLPVGRTGC